MLPSILMPRVAMQQIVQDIKWIKWWNMYFYMYSWPRKRDFATYVRPFLLSIKRKFIDQNVDVFADTRI